LLQPQLSHQQRSRSSNGSSHHINSKSSCRHVLWHRRAPLLPQPQQLIQHQQEQQLIEQQQHVPPALLGAFSQRLVRLSVKLYGLTPDELPLQAVEALSALLLSSRGRFRCAAACRTLSGKGASSWSWMCWSGAAAVRVQVLSSKDQLRLLLQEAAGKEGHAQMMPVVLEPLPQQVCSQAAGAAAADMEGTWTDAAEEAAAALTVVDGSSNGRLSELEAEQVLREHVPFAQLVATLLSLPMEAAPGAGCASSSSSSSACRGGDIGAGATSDPRCPWPTPGGCLCPGWQCCGGLGTWSDEARLDGYVVHSGVVAVRCRSGCGESGCS